MLNTLSLPKIRKQRILDHDKIKKVSTTWEGIPEKLGHPMDAPTELLQFVQRLAVTCIPDGVGLAAPQIGLFKRLFVMKENSRNFHVCLHPNFEVLSDSIQYEDTEWCLSVRSGSRRIQRESKILASWIEVEFQTKKLIPVQTILTGREAIIFQHEYDHLNGVSIVERAAGLTT